MNRSTNAPSALQAFWQGTFRNRRPACALALLLAGLLVAAGLGGPDPTWPSIRKYIAETHPGLPSMTTTELDKRLRKGERPVLIDARASAEFAISHLRGARRATSVEAALRILGEKPKDTPVVVYCSVGVRSAALTAKLRAKGFVAAKNLDGSLFEWANKGYPIFRGARDEAPAKKVHPFDARWGRLLREDLRADVTRDPRAADR